MHPVQRIYVTGFMGVGKSTVGPRVAKRMGFSSMDLDNEITRYLGLSIPGIFEVMGEDAFRDAESELLLKASTTNQIVVSLGGGAICREENLQLCLNTGFLVYLQATPSFLAKRLERSRQTRPKLFDAEGQMLMGAHLEERVAQLLAEREPFYRRAHAILSVDDQNTSQLANQIQQRIRSAGNGS